MEQIEINVVGLQALELIFQKDVKVLGLFHSKHRHFGGQVYFIPITIFQCFAHQRLTLLVVIKIGGVYIIHPRINGAAEHPDGLGLVNGFSVFQQGKAHTAKSQRRNGNAGISHFSILHGKAPLFSAGLPAVSNLRTGQFYHGQRYFSRNSAQALESSFSTNRR